MVLDGFFNFIFGFAINLGPPWSIVIIAFILTLLITLAYKYLTDQDKMKELKTQLKSVQKEIKDNKNKASML